MCKTENKSSEQLFDKVLKVSEQIEASCKPAPYKVAQQMLRLMGGDSSVLRELPTVAAPLRAVGMNTDENTLIEETSETSIRESEGLLGLTKENIIAIKTYVKTALTLKTTKEEAAKELGYTDDEPFSKEHPYFSPTSFAAFYSPFHTHAELWNNLETRIIDQGNQLKIYGRTFVSHAEFVYQQMKSMKLFSAVEDAYLAEPEDLEKQEALGKILEKWKEETNKYKANTEELLADLSSFQETLVKKLSPSANIMTNKLSELDIEKETSDLKKEITSLEAEIRAKQAEYDKDCGLACSGSAGILAGPLVLLTWSITGGIYGAKAEEVRKERNRLQGELSEIQMRYNSLNKVAASVHKAASGVENLKLAITNAIIGLNTLNAVWGLMSGYIGSAKESLGSIKEKSDLLDCMFELTNAHDSWREVPEIAAGLLGSFNEAEAALKHPGVSAGF